MLRKDRLPLLISLIICTEILIYLWAWWTATLDKENFFAIEPEFIFDKCARNSGRISAGLNLVILIMIGHLGLTKIYSDDATKDKFRILITLFAVNHLAHFFFVFQNFKHHTISLNISDNFHGFFTFTGVLLVPVIIWLVKNLNPLLYLIILVHLFNASYFIMETFYNKIKPDKPAYHNQFGILITCIALAYILFRVFKEVRTRMTMA